MEHSEEEIENFSKYTYNTHLIYDIYDYIFTVQH